MLSHYVDFSIPEKTIQLQWRRVKQYQQLSMFRSIYTYISPSIGSTDMYDVGSTSFVSVISGHTFLNF